LPLYLLIHDKFLPKPITLFLVTNLDFDQTDITFAFELTEIPTFISALLILEIVEMTKFTVLLYYCFLLYASCAEGKFLINKATLIKK